MKMCTCNIYFWAYISICRKYIIKPNFLATIAWPSKIVGNCAKLKLFAEWYIYLFSLRNSPSNKPAALNHNKYYNIYDVILPQHKANTYGAWWCTVNTVREQQCSLKINKIRHILLVLFPERMFIVSKLGIIITTDSGCIRYNAHTNIIIVAGFFIHEKNIITGTFYNKTYKASQQNIYKYIIIII